MKNAAILYAREGTLEDRNTLFFLKVLYEFFNTLKDLKKWSSSKEDEKERKHIQKNVMVPHLIAVAAVVAILIPPTNTLVGWFFFHCAANAAFFLDFFHKLKPIFTRLMLPRALFNEV